MPKTLPRRRKPAAAKPGTPRRRKTAPSDPPAVIALAAPPGKPKQARRKKAMARKPRSAGTGRAKAPPTIFAMPPCPEPLVDTSLALAQPLVPLPRQRALTRPGPTGLIDAMARWIGSRLVRLIEVASHPAPPRRLPLARARRREATELARLQAENAHLRRQLEHLVALDRGRTGRVAPPGQAMPMA